MSDTEPFKRAHAAALRFLSHRPRSEAEVRTHLHRRFSATLSQRVVESLKEDSLLDDSAFALLWKESRVSHRPRSAWAIKRELAAKGVRKGLAEEAVRDVDDYDTAYRAGLVPARRIGAADLATFRRRLWGFLRRRGFSESVSRQTINRLQADVGAQAEPWTSPRDAEPPEM